MECIDDAELSVVSAAIIKRCLVQIHCDVSVEQTSALVCLRCCKKTERRVDWTMRWTARVKSGAFV